MGVSATARQKHSHPRYGELPSTKLPSWADEVRLRKPTAAESKKSAAHFAELCDIRRRTGASLLEARHILAKQHKGLGCTCSSCLIVGEAQAAARGTAV